MEENEPLSAKYNPENAGSISTDLSKALSGGKATEFQNSERLKDFYKKLLQTDAQIQLLKKGVTDIPLLNANNDLYLTPFDRSKRSLKHPQIAIKNKLKDRFGNGILVWKNMNKRISKQRNTGNNFLRNKRYDYNVTKPNAFFIEKKKIVVKYEPSENNVEVRRKVPKCSHAPKDSKSHEKQLKHPFYKNSQRLDELLDQFLDKNIPEIMTDPLNLDLFKTVKTQCKHPKADENVHFYKSDSKHPAVNKEKEGKDYRNMHSEELKRLIMQDSTSMNTNDNLKHIFHNAKSERKPFESSTENFNVVLSISTIMNPVVIKAGTYPDEDIVERGPNLRKLMQLEDEDVDLSYKDVDEVLADDTEIHDETEKHIDRKKRDQSPNSQLNVKYHPLRVHIPNWKGPMPLYPDEINSMIKQAALSANQLVLLNNENNANSKNEIPLKNKDISAEIDIAERDMNDVEYIESYTNDKYDKLVKMAQAYSDYGVLEDKKLSTSNEKNKDKVTDHKTKLSVDNGSIKRGLFGRSKKFALQKSNGIKNKTADPSEGLRFEVKPISSTGREDKPTDVYKMLQKHIKISHDREMKKPNIAAPFYPTEADIDLMYTPTKYDNDKYHTWEHGKNKYGHKSDNPETDFIYTLSKGKRSLQSIEYDEQEDRYTGEDLSLSNDRNTTNSEDIHQGKKDTVNNNIKKEIDKLTVIKQNEIRHKEQNILSIYDYDPKDSMSKFVVNNIKVRRDTSAYNNSKKDIGYSLTENISNIDFHNIALSNYNESQINHDEFPNRTELSRNVMGDSHKEIHINRNYNEQFMDNSLNNTTIIKELKNTDKGLSDFFLLLSNFFSFMDILDNSIPPNVTENSTNNCSDISTIHYPIYDSDMTENIGHRSRVLMAIVDKNITEKSGTEDSNSKVELYQNSMDKSDTDKNMNNSNITKTMNLNNATELKTDANGVTKELKKQDNVLENKTIVKRNAVDSSLIFWNDIYDDEYGVEIDPFENNIRDKHSNKRTNFIKSSGLWFQDKVKKFSDNLKKKVKSSENDGAKNRNNDNEKTKKNDGRQRISRGIKVNGLRKRELKIIKDDTEPSKRDLESLKANMKDICRKAARAVQQTRSLEAREDTKEGTMASTLMQQLVRLMTDLVDYQVQQKTCLKLPSDLQNFLEWLVAPNDKASESNFKMKFEDEDNIGLDIGNVAKPTEHYLDMMMHSTMDTERLHPDEKTEPHAILHAVKDLITQYELMTDDDKSKISGIKEYLESQREFLQKQTSFDEFNTYPNKLYPMRFRRDLKHRSARNDYAKHFRRKRKLGKFMKNFGKKHTKTTASHNDAAQITEVKKSYKNDPKVNDKNLETKRMSRNLRDVYYKAVSDAKKITTSKTIH